MPIIFNCPSCGRELEAPDSAAGSAGSCRFCGAEITAPAAPNQPAGLVSPGAPPPPWPGAYGASTEQPTGRLNPFGVVSEAVSAYGSNFGVLFVSVIIVFVLEVVAGQVVGAATRTLPRAMSEMAGVAVSVLLAPLFAGPLYIGARAVAGRDAGVGNVFQGFKHAGALMAASLLLGIPWLIALQMMPQPPAAVQAGSADPAAALAWIAAFLPWMGLSVLLITALLVPVSLTNMEIVDRGTGVADAIRASIESTRGHYFLVLITRLMAMVVAATGLILCGVGIILTIPITFVVEVLIYRHLRGLHGTPDA